jgi:Matrixin
VLAGTERFQQGLRFVAARFDGDSALLAANIPNHATSDSITVDQVQPLLVEAIARWQAAGMDTSSLHGIDVRVADLGGTTLGLASGHKIWLDDNAAGWGWFVDPKPGDDGEFSTPGNQGEQRRMDLLTVLEHEIGHLLGQEHEAGGVMAETLAPGIRQMPGSDASPADPIATRGPLDLSPRPSLEVDPHETWSRRRK